jgi:hypothetical protein
VKNSVPAPAVSGNEVHVTLSFFVSLLSVKDSRRNIFPNPHKDYFAVYINPPKDIVMAKGTKRGSPGAVDEKNPITSSVVGEEESKKLEEIQRDLARVELVLGVSLF